MTLKVYKIITYLSIIILFSGFISTIEDNTEVSLQNDIIDQKVDSLLAIMTLEEKVGQMNLYNGFWDVTGPAPKEGNAKIKYEHLRKGWVGGMLNVRGVDNVKMVQQIAVE